MLHAVVASSSCLISKVRVSLSLRDRVSSGSFGFALVLAQDWLSITPDRTAVLSSSRCSKLTKNLKGRPLQCFKADLKWPMCKTPFCVSLLCFGGQNPSFVFNERQLVEAIFAGICVCTSVWGAAASLHRDSRCNELSFWRKRRIPGTESSSSLFFSLSITCQSLRKPVSCLLGFHTLVLSLSVVHSPLKWFGSDLF